MSGSTVSAAETGGSSVASRPEKRSLSPSGSNSPEPHRPRSSLSPEHPSWDFDSDTEIVETDLDEVPFISTTSPYGTAISSTSLSSSQVSSPNFTSPIIPDISSQVTPTSTYVEAPPRDDWNSSNQNYAYPSNNTSLNTTNSPMPSAAPASATPSSPAPSSTPVRVQVRGKVPNETADPLKAWLHRHSDHPYPSEVEERQLSSATGLSMSQVSNWMINARRRILTPAHQAAQGPVPYPSQVEQASPKLPDSDMIRHGGVGDVSENPAMSDNI